MYLVVFGHNKKREYRVEMTSEGGIRSCAGEGTILTKPTQCSAKKGYLFVPVEDPLEDLF